MKRYFGLAAAARDREPRVSRVASIGFFDGVHLGHAKILRDLKEWAAATASESAVVTFDRHPQAVLGGHPLVPLISLEHRLLLLAREGVTATLVLPFDRDLASWSPERFIRNVLHEALGAPRLLLGFDGAFGKDRKGTHENLKDRRDEIGTEVRRSDESFVRGARVSSSLVREELRRGNLMRVAELLGRPFSLVGKVVDGDHRGATIGFPTANLDIREAAVLPRGIYFADAVRLGRSLEEVAGDGQVPAIPHAAVVNVGRRPTFTGGDDTTSEAFDPERDKVEVHLLDFEGDLYDDYVEVFVYHKHRSEQRFPSVELLVEQIESDVAARRTWDRRANSPEETS